MVGIVLRFEIQQKRRISLARNAAAAKSRPQGNGRLFGQHFARRPCRVFQVIRHIIENF